MGGATTFFNFCDDCGIGLPESLDNIKSTKARNDWYLSCDFGIISKKEIFALSNY
jgi:hypothetical protein